MKKKVVLLDAPRRDERKYWVHLINRRRNDLGLYATCSGIAVENFDIILGLMEPHSRRQDTLMRLATEPGLKLAVTLQHLAEGGHSTCE